MISGLVSTFSENFPATSQTGLTFRFLSFFYRFLDKLGNLLSRFLTFIIIILSELLKEPIYPLSDICVEIVAPGTLKYLAFFHSHTVSLVQD